MIGTPEQNCITLNLPGYKSGRAFENGDEANFLHILNSYWQDTLVRPLIVNLNNNILCLQQERHTHKEIQYMNSVGLNIMLFEPLCLYHATWKLPEYSASFNKHGVHNFGFYSEFGNKLEDWDDARAVELDCILEYVLKNDLTNVTVFTGDYNVEKLTHYNQMMQLVCRDVFLDTQVIFDNVLEIPYKQNIEHKFLSSNWRWSTARHVIDCVLRQKSSITSNFFDCDLNIVLSAPWLHEIQQYPDMLDYISNGTAQLNADPARGIDAGVGVQGKTLVEHYGAHFYPNVALAKSPVQSNRHNLPLKDAYGKCFADIVCESRFAQPTANLGEKIIQPMTHKTPFVLVGAQYALEYAKKLGYKTFDTWWDESYDVEGSHIKRMDKIIKVIEYIEDLSISDCEQMYNEMKTVIDHNLNTAVKNTWPNKLQEHMPYNPDNDSEAVGEVPHE